MLYEVQGHYMRARVDMQEGPSVIGRSFVMNADVIEL